MPRPLTSIMNNKEVVADAIAKSETISDVLQALGLRAAGGNYQSLKKAADRHGLTLPVLPADHPRRKVGASMLRISDDKIFTVDSTYNNRTGIKKRLREAGHVFVCAACGIGEIWNNRPLTLQLEHVNGVFNDHRKENLVLLCPNCHSQTSTFAGRNRRTSPRW